jgi:hypothetical protein
VTLVHFFAQKSFIWVALDCLLEQKYTQKGKKEHYFLKEFVGWWFQSVTVV